MSHVTSFIWENKDWLFSGIGILTLGFIFNAFKLSTENQSSSSNLSGYWRTAYIHKLIHDKKVIEIWKIKQVYNGKIKGWIEHYTTQGPGPEKLCVEGIVRGDKLTIIWYPFDPKIIATGTLALRCKYNKLIGIYVSFIDTNLSNDKMIISDPDSFNLKTINIPIQYRLRRFFKKYLFESYESAAKFFDLYD